MRRVAIVGSTSAGKSTLARALAGRLGAPHVELDALYWNAGWTPTPKELFRERVAAALAVDRWVVDGSYGAVRDFVWPSADTLVWLDYSLLVLLYRLIRRTIGRVVRDEELWNGNREQLRTHLLSRESLFVWLVTTYRRRRREYETTLARPEHDHLAVHRFRSPRETRAWLERLTVPTAAGAT